MIWYKTKIIWRLRKEVFMEKETIELLNQKDWELIRDLQNLESKLIDMTYQIRKKIDKIKRRKNI